MANLVELKHYCQHILHQTVDFSFRDIPDGVVLQGPGTMMWQASEPYARAKAFHKASTAIYQQSTEGALRGLLGLPADRHIPEINEIRRATAVVRRMGHGRGHGFGPAIGQLYAAIDNIETVLKKIGY